MTNGKRAMGHCKSFHYVICAFCLALRGDFQKNEASELLWIHFAIAIVFPDIPAKEVEKHVTIARYWIFVRQEEDGH
ncbi:hypothetical protein [Escherichia albertii]|uniref:hypothetical protein n=1 Tax=Escherichia albertii TaxID=208962 RepID=UPI0007443499|nr:hypothetical protein [Escherichia albertii]EJI9010514.1 hypothetical protein [Escherichia albertii]EJQ6145777.1 hypothetical protein [Escherichia albertii]ELY3286757.1 hypothetical protein [Escherichia albertii]MCE7710557.1 hypothetical protein [Escherichia albertii]MCQ8913095.1 hypothetical protein [Escherichia albertii]